MCDVPGNQVYPRRRADQICPSAVQAEMAPVIFLNNDAKVLGGDIQAGETMVHIINRVLGGSSWLGFDSATTPSLALP
jgi:hypothetical protein